MSIRPNALKPNFSAFLFTVSCSIAVCLPLWLRSTNFNKYYHYSFGWSTMFCYTSWIVQSWIESWICACSHRITDSPVWLVQHVSTRSGLATVWIVACTMICQIESKEFPFVSCWYASVGPSLLRIYDDDGATLVNVNDWNVLLWEWRFFWDFNERKYQSMKSSQETVFGENITITVIGIWIDTVYPGYWSNSFNSSFLWLLCCISYYSIFQRNN